VFRCRGTGLTGCSLFSPGDAMTKASRYRWLCGALGSGRHELSGGITIGGRELPMPILAFANLSGGAPTVRNDGIPLRGMFVNLDH
jgi:hypothetical protein